MFDEKDVKYYRAARRVVAEGQLAIHPQLVACVVGDDIADVRAAEAVAG